MRVSKITNFAKRVVKRVAFRTLGRDRSRDFLLKAQSELGLFPGRQLPQLSVGYQMRKAVRRSSDWRKAAQSVPADRQVLIVNPRGVWYLGALQGVLACRLRLEGFAPLVFLCQDLPVCNNRSVLWSGDENQCTHCLAASQQMANVFGFPHVSIDQLISPQIRARGRSLVEPLQLEDIDAFQYRGMPFGNYIRVSASSYFFRGTPERTPEALEVLKGFLYGLIVLYHAYEQLYEDLSPDDLVVICNGRFFWYRLAYEMAVKRGLKAVTYDDFGSLGGTGKVWMFSNKRPIAHLDLSDAWLEWRGIPLTPEEDRYLEEKFVSYGPRNPRYYPEADEDWVSIAASIGLDQHHLFDTAYTNLTWDSTAIDKDVVFSSMINWILKTVECYQENGRTLLIRVHPAEESSRLGFPNRQRVIDEVARHFPSLPANVHLISPASPISSYTLLRRSRLNLVYTSTLGFEGAIRGLPMVVAGDAHYRGKGFTIDVESRGQYRALLAGEIVPDPPTEGQAELARRYAFLYLYRTRIPLELYEAEKFQVRLLSFSSLDELLPGENSYLDWLMYTMLDGGTFAMPRTLTNRFLGIEQ